VKNEELAPLLLVDDDLVLCSVLAPALRKRGFKVTIAHDYQGAVACAAQNPPEFAVVDLKFPGGSGLQLVQKLVEAGRHTRVVMLTGYASIATAVEAVKLHAHYYLAKPVSADDIVAALRRDSSGAPTPISERPLSVSRLEWEHIHRILTSNGGNVSETARALGMHRRTLQRKLGKHPVRD
jgi:two-component system response regulator RegA